MKKDTRIKIFSLFASLIFLSSVTLIIIGLLTNPMLCLVGSVIAIITPLAHMVVEQKFYNEPARKDALSHLEKQKTENKITESQYTIRKKMIDKYLPESSYKGIGRYYGMLAIALIASLAIITPVSFFLLESTLFSAIVIPISIILGFSALFGSIAVSTSTLIECCARSKDKQSVPQYGKYKIADEILDGKLDEKDIYLSESGQGADAPSSDMYESSSKMALETGLMMAVGALACAACAGCAGGIK